MRAALTAALTLPLLQASTRAQNPDNAIPKLTDLLKDRSVTLVRAKSLFMPGKDGRGPRVVTGDSHALAYKRGKLLGLVEITDSAPPKNARAKILDYREAHPDSFAIPGFVDADSRWFRNMSDLNDRRTDPTAKAAEALELWQEGWDELVEEGGITSVFVPASVASQTSGAGSLISIAGRQAKSLGDGAFAWRMSSPATRGTSLTRGNVAKGLAASFEAARKYDEAKEKYKKDLEEYKKKRKEFLAYYKKNPLKKGEEIKEAAPKPTRSRRRGLPKTKEELERMLQRVPPSLRDRMRKRIEAQMKAAAAAAKPKDEKKPDAKDAKSKAGAKKKAPPRPKRPKKLKADPAKEAMLRILSGKASLRIEVHRAGEIRALLDVAKEEGIEKIVVVGATEGWKVAKDLRVAGASVVLRPETLPSTGFDTLPDQLASSAAKLADEGVPVAFGSAGRERARTLPLLAARAVSRGMEEGAAMQALTQGGIEASGVDGEIDTGIVVWSGHPLSITSRPLHLVRGRRVRAFGKAASGDKR